MTANLLFTLFAVLMAAGFFCSAFIESRLERTWRVGHHTFEEHYSVWGRTWKKRYSARAWLIRPGYNKANPQGTEHGYSLELMGINAPNGERYFAPSEERCEACGKWLPSVTGWPLEHRILALKIDD